MLGGAPDGCPGGLWCWMEPRRAAPEGCGAGWSPRWLPRRAETLDGAPEGYPGGPYHAMRDGAPEGCPGGLYHEVLDGAQGGLPRRAMMLDEASRSSGKEAGEVVANRREVALGWWRIGERWQKAHNLKDCNHLERVAQELFIEDEK
jgi:hypothetical protein